MKINPGRKDLAEIEALIQKWAIKKGLADADPRAQFLKVAEEFGEIASSMARNDMFETKDAIGDTVVTLSILALQLGTDLTECTTQAYDVIKGRTGKMVNGTFIKSEDLEKMEVKK